MLSVCSSDITSIVCSKIMAKILLTNDVLVQQEDERNAVEDGRVSDIVFSSSALSDYYHSVTTDPDDVQHCSYFYICSFLSMIPSSHWLCKYC